MSETIKVIKVGIADMNIVKSPYSIRTAGLGSCVGVVLFEPLKQVAGMVHIMLPDSSLAIEGILNAAKYADTGIRELVRKLETEGLRCSMMKAKIAGGAQMFQFSSGNDLMRIGPRNEEAVRKTLQQLNIELLAADCGGNNGRTIEFDPITKKLSIRTVNKGVKEL
ncbi:chemotaxis protein CheD [Bacillus sp. AGMB 02131]|uniref:Probable chemoreceptor glutamine deamidase CheD n=1 Tax=Peribacillus faecalis TaxID=2772559 RepID=A0A927D0Q7_9BACI|nr:chemotaxis protein CheD [Peribacillus faecalis]MBD3109420.1 chemotaxis protein CheD [Peribacillus faecalis]